MSAFRMSSIAREVELLRLEIFEYDIGGDKMRLDNSMYETARNLERLSERI